MDETQRITIKSVSRWLPDPEGIQPFLLVGAGLMIGAATGLPVFS
jgi:hypothetical protein